LAWTQWCYNWADNIHKEFSGDVQDENNASSEVTTENLADDQPNNGDDEDVVMFHELLLLQVKLADQLVFLTLLKRYASHQLHKLRLSSTDWTFVFSRRSLLEARSACDKFDHLLSAINKNSPPESDYPSDFVAKWNYLISEFNCRQPLHWGHYFYLRAHTKTSSTEIKQELTSAQRHLHAAFNSPFFLAKKKKDKF